MGDYLLPEMYRAITFFRAFIVVVLAVNTVFTEANPIKTTDISLKESNGTSGELRIWDVGSEFVLENTHFLLWTRSNMMKDGSIEYKELQIGNTSALAESGFSNKKKTKILAHGFQQSGYTSGSILAMRDAYLLREDCNFISVDWASLATFPFYIRAVTYSTLVGEQTGNLINFLVEQGADLKDFHVIGFSLGAHVAGKAGATVNGVLPRITGLDPAYPLFSMVNTDQRLDTTDAEFVDVIHTHSGLLITSGLSFLDPIGHVDFYPNGGSAQVGCGLISGFLCDMLEACSHGRALDYFTESINSLTGFTGVCCESYYKFQVGDCSDNPTALMGEPATKTDCEVFYLNTNSESPFAMETSS